MKNTQKYFILLLMLILLVPSNIWGQETKKEIIVKGDVYKRQVMRSTVSEKVTVTCYGSVMKKD